MSADDQYQVSWDEDAAIARTTWSPGAHCDLARAKAINAEIRGFASGKVCLLVDLRDGVQFDRDAREFLMNQNPHYRAVALLAQNAPARMLANFFLGLRRGDIPLRMFAAEADAVAWLRSQP
ncbi:STAS/SEC14 domain-containing protein [Nocardioides sp. T2.26MG-1]|uniref:STAS/SEC14 domain-containing protein n=1 Tax=Nocardioides sp. T2.26MG-1 TaxID=3041166 RepID=UPI002477B1CE|nr:STAS/SEC14 domain-containing protein [Nocardioides sp. T2.26MG-1]CAI9417648.1 hypothetical protein HIDPHFAB_03072 [Nocardioides sp. T2.26MG-1]